MSRVHLFVHSLVPHDAISNHTRHVQKLLQQNDLLGATYVWESRGAKKSEIRSYRDFDASKIREGDIALYQLSTGSRIAGVLADSSVRLAINYHNITTPEFYDDWEPHVGGELDKGLRQLRELAPRTELAIAVSSFNEEELRAVGYRQTTVVPILFDTNSFSRQGDAAVTRELEQKKQAGESIWLFVGRLSPNKTQHDIIKAFAYYRQVINPNAHLYLVGGSSSHAYEAALHQFIETAGVKDNVTITGAVSDAELSAYYQQSSVFVCLSEHEGFCVPLLEAFYNELPIVAYGSSAVPETLGDGGLLLSDKSPAMVASAVDAVLTNKELAQQLIQNGKRRLQDFNLETTQAAFLSALSKVGVS